MEANPYKGGPAASRPQKPRPRLRRRRWAKGVERRHCRSRWADMVSSRLLPFSRTLVLNVSRICIVMGVIEPDFTQFGNTPSLAEISLSSWVHHDIWVEFLGKLKKKPMVKIIDAAIGV
ncbi:hypothetical protein E2562_034523 [Oryza meyeriana var. granulata]|uniref:Uncharacterized protein n=1 Tax=Oryza meyeriana var. granulata TaxID=110450 RepID=A0A6G1CAI1_9ORYZ|nr:hypothetical protein E2562_034523 [Oryza meyeriana var. granulata]